MPFLMHTLQILRNRHPLDIYLTFSPAWTDKIQLTMKNGDFFSGPRCREIIILDKKGKKDKPLCSLKSLRPGLESKVGRCPFSRTTVLRRPLALLRFIARFWGYHLQAPLQWGLVDYIVIPECQEVSEGKKVVNWVVLSIWKMSTKKSGLAPRRSVSFLSRLRPDHLASSPKIR